MRAALLRHWILCHLIVVVELIDELRVGMCRATEVIPVHHYDGQRIFYEQSATQPKVRGLQTRANSSRKCSLPFQA